MRTLRPLAMALAAAVGVGQAGIAHAQQLTCSVIGVSGAIAAKYDPFAPEGFPSTEVTMTLTRQNAVGGGDPRIVNMYLTGPASTNGAQVEVLSVSPFGTGQVSAEGIGFDIYYDTTDMKPAVIPIGNVPTSAKPFLKINFTGNNADSDRAIVKFRVTLPPQLDVSAGGSLAFDGNYGCFIRGGSGNGISSESFFGNAVTFQITVLSALQASYSGTALDFGEIGDITTASLVTTPVVTATNNHVRVQSSGPYEVTLDSANDFYMTPNGATTNNTLEKVGYNLRFLGVTRNPGNTALISMVCPRAGVGTSFEDQLDIQAKLAEGGTGKVTSPTYLDTLTVTVAPKAAATATTSGGDCDALPGRF